MHRYSKISLKRSGFTLIELFVVLLIIGLLAAYFGQSIFGQANDSKVSIARTQIINAIPSALMGYYGGVGHDGPSLSSLSDPDSALVSRGVNPSSPWGPKWTLLSESTSADQHVVRIRYPLGKTSSQAKSNIAQIVNTTTSGSKHGSAQWDGPVQMPIIKEIQEDPSNDAVVVTYLFH